MGDHETADPSARGGDAAVGPGEVEVRRVVLAGLEGRLREQQVDAVEYASVRPLADTRRPKVGMGCFTGTGSTTNGPSWTGPPCS